MPIENIVTRQAIIAVSLNSGFFFIVCCASSFLYIHFKTSGHVMKSPLKIYVFTDNIIVIDGVQYRLYGNEFIETFGSLVS